ncbi:MAG: tRNA-binding protein [Conexivisphaera sp.]|jgi:tRNA-binding protein
MSEPISYEEFARLDLRVCRVVDAERIEGRKKVIKLTVDLGDERRTVVAGGAEYYSPDQFKGRLMIIVANLEPRLIAGVESKGMLLAADVEGRPIWLTVAEEVPPGTKIR